MKNASLFINCFDFMKPAEKRISIVLSDFWLAKKMGGNPKSKIHPSIATIAKKSKCCARTVNRYLKNFEFLFSKVRGRYIWSGKIDDRKYQTERQGRFLANEYDLDQGFFEFIAFIKYKKFTNYWEKVRLSITSKMSENQELTMKILEYDLWVMNMQMSHGLSEKCRTISCISSSKHQEIRISGKERENAQNFGGSLLRNELLDGIQVQGLNEKALGYANRHASKEVIRRVNLSYAFNRDRGNTIYHPSAWFIKAVQTEMKFESRLLCR